MVKHFTQCLSCLPQWPLHICYSHIWSTELALCIPSNSLYLFCTCRLRWGSEVSPLMDGRVSPSMDRPPGTVCHLHYESTSTRAITERFHTCTEDATVLDCPAPRYFYAILTPNHGLSRRYDGSRHDEWDLLWARSPIRERHIRWQIWHSKLMVDGGPDLRRSRLASNFWMRRTSNSSTADLHVERQPVLSIAGAISSWL